MKRSSQTALLSWINGSLFSLVVFTTLLAVNDAAAQNIQRWVHAGFAETNSPDYLNEQKYPTTLRESDVYQFFMEDVNNLGVTPEGRGFLRARIELLKKFGTLISVESYGINPVVRGYQNPVDGKWVEVMLCNEDNINCTPTPAENNPNDYGPERVGQESARVTLRKIKPIFDAGGEVNYLALDGAAIGRVREGGQGSTHATGCSFTKADSFVVLKSYMRAIHGGVAAWNGQEAYEGRPKIKIGLVANFANYKYGNIPAYDNDNNLAGEDFGVVLHEMIAAVVNDGETLWFVHTDSPYNYTIPVEYPNGTPAPNQWRGDAYLGRLLSLRDQVRGHGLRFGLIFNTDRPTEWWNSDQIYTNDTLKYIRDYLARSGWDYPDDFIVESWYNNPHKTFPESEEFTFTNLVKKIATPGTAEHWGTDHRHSRHLDKDVFDWEYYLATDSVLQQGAMQYSSSRPRQRVWAEWHWLNWGFTEGRRGANTFAAPHYLARYGDISGEYGSTNYPAAVEHYFLWGRNEGRSTVLKAKAGLQHSAVLFTGDPWAAGQNTNGQLANGTTTLSTSPVATLGIGALATEVAAGDYNSLAVRPNGTVWTWGSNQYGLRGDGSGGSYDTQARIVPNFGNMIAPSEKDRRVIASGMGASAAVDKSGQVWTWGVNWNGRLGDGGTVAHYVPARVKKSATEYLTGIVSVSVGSGHMLALHGDGTVWTWGAGSYGALGQGSTQDRYYAVQVRRPDGTPLQRVTQAICGGSYFSLALTSDGLLYGWGNNGSGQLGLGTQSSFLYPTQVNITVDKIAAGGYHAVACNSSTGQAYSWGYNGWGQVGKPGATTYRTPVEMIAGPEGMNGITDVAAGGYFSLMIRGYDWAVFGVGDNQSGQLALGNGNRAQQNEPRRTTY